MSGLCLICLVLSNILCVCIIFLKLCIVFLGLGIMFWGLVWSVGESFKVSPPQSTSPPGPTAVAVLERVAASHPKKGQYVGPYLIPIGCVY